MDYDEFIDSCSDSLIDLEANTFKMLLNDKLNVGFELLTESFNKSITKELHTFSSKVSQYYIINEVSNMPLEIQQVLTETERIFIKLIDYMDRVEVMKSLPAVKDILNNTVSVLYPKGFNKLQESLAKYQKLTATKINGKSKEIVLIKVDSGYNFILFSKVYKSISDLYFKIYKIQPTSKKEEMLRSGILKIINRKYLMVFIRILKMYTNTIILEERYKLLQQKIKIKVK